MRVVEREKHVLEQLVALVDRRLEAQRAADTAFRTGEQRIGAEFQQVAGSITALFHDEAGSAERAERASRESQVAQWKSQSRQIEDATQDAVQRLVNDINRAERKAHKAVDEARWLARTVFEAAQQTYVRAHGRIAAATAQPAAHGPGDRE